MVCLEAYFQEAVSESGSVRSISSWKMWWSHRRTVASLNVSICCECTSNENVLHSMYSLYLQDSKRLSNPLTNEIWWTTESSTLIVALLWSLVAGTIPLSLPNDQPADGAVLKHVSCDQLWPFHKEFFTKLGVRLNDPATVPDDPYSRLREQVGVRVRTWGIYCN